jgi:orotate phosphoribosyltransferase
MNKQQYKTLLAQRIYNACALHGKFTLHSGKTSNIYFDKYLFESDPVLLSNITNYMVKLITSDTEILAGLELGGIPIVTSISLTTNIPAVYVRKQAKAYGTQKIAEGTDVKNKHVLIIEDVITSGKSIIAAVKNLRRSGAIVSNVLCVINREVLDYDSLFKNNLHVTSVFNISELTSLKDERK